MNREEAIEMLKSKMDGSVDTSYEWAETVRMAIEALSGEVKTRCIAQIKIDRDDMEKLVNEKVNEIVDKMSETKTGEWIDKGNWLGIECSRCKCHSRYVTPFCPQCGARMLREDGEA